MDILREIIDFIISPTVRAGLLMLYAVAILGVIRFVYVENGKKVSTKACDERMIFLKDMVARIMRLEGYFFERPFTPKEAEKFLKKENNIIKPK
jgi:hypothetical protein